MPKRLECFCKGGFYHVFNKTIDRKSVFIQSEMRTLFKNVLQYYQAELIKEKFSDFKRRMLRLPKRQPPATPDQKRLFSCLAYCFMPNHFHFLLRQNSEYSLSHALRRTLISFTRTYNLLNHRQGPLFLAQFRVVEIGTEEQLIHLSRYIHLNPYSAAIINDPKAILTSPLSSMPAYLQASDSLCETDFLLEIFANDRKKYADFVLENAEHQRKLAVIKKSLAS